MYPTVTYQEIENSHSLQNNIKSKSLLCPIKSKFVFIERDRTYLTNNDNLFFSFPMLSHKITSLLEVVIDCNQEATLIYFD